MPDRARFHYPETLSHAANRDILVMLKELCYRYRCRLDCVTSSRSVRRVTERRE